MKQIAFVFILTTLLLGSCAPATDSPTPPVVDPVTPTTIPSQTPPPTPSAIPSATPYPPLHTQGPYLLFTRDNKFLTIMDADGSGRKQIQLPEDGYMKELKRSVSPDGNWMAYFTGSKSKPYDLALNLFNLEDETTSVIANIIASGFPENLEPVTETAYFTEYDTDCSNDTVCRLSLVEAEFENGIESLSWSPDSKSLAFAAQIDGPSADIYLYNVGEKSIRRLTNELANVRQIDWAPNGKKILYETSQPGTVYISRTLHIADPNNEALQNPKELDGGLFWQKYGWIDENLYLLSSGGEGGPPQDVRYINTDSYKSKVIWPNEANLVIINSLNKQVLIGIPESEVPDTKGMYIVSLDGSYKKISNDFYYPFEYQNLSNIYFGLDGIENQRNELVSISLDGIIKNLSRNVYISQPPIPSPDGKWILISDNKGIELYSENLELIKSWYPASAGTIIWMPDSKGVLLYNQFEGQIGIVSYLSIPSGIPMEVDILSQYNCCSFEYVWLP